ncbi:hypothetical protein GTA51_19440 [Desulfovibrio aerotolerans]|uniref:Uncharacterized protein n=1 Tax=Solidesulfovibrio aerotolerans TaxID=295255 RepID=A0A7C9MR69_9BACT|nr:hypothetical protein [Solidesulfovibrio aerotolerans]MYL85272.1 hypothetical protein [Solidesulfovibrio aerotolerans]
MNQTLGRIVACSKEKRIFRAILSDSRICEPGSGPGYFENDGGIVFPDHSSLKLYEGEVLNEDSTPILAFDLVEANVMKFSKEIKDMFVEAAINFHNNRRVVTLAGYSGITQFSRKHLK